MVENSVENLHEWWQEESEREKKEDKPQGPDFLEFSIIA